MGRPLALFPCEYCSEDPATGKKPIVAEGSNCAKCKKFPSWKYRDEHVGAFHREIDRQVAANKARRG